MGLCFSKKKQKRLPPGDPTKRAVLIGCNYTGTKHQLNGCVRDAEIMRNLLIARYQFLPQNVVVLRDDARDPRLWPTRDNILLWLGWLLQCPNATSLVFHFSGHGVRCQDPTGEEPDGKCNALMPVDYQRSGPLLDKTLNRALVNRVPRGAQLFAIIDACHSGTALDLPYNCRRRVGTISWKDTFSRPPKSYKGTQGGRAIQISAACDVQKAIDTSEFTGRAQGAATFAFVAALHANQGQLSYQQLLVYMHKLLDSSDRFGLRPKTGQLGAVCNALFNAAGYRGQTPVLSSDHKFDLKTPFWL